MKSFFLGLVSGGILAGLSTTLILSGNPPINGQTQEHATLNSPRENTNITKNAFSELNLSSKECSPITEKQNKAIVASIKPLSPEFHELIAEGYIQHAPEYDLFAQLNNVSPPDAVKLIEKYNLGLTGKRFGARLPGQPDDVFNYKILADCDLVISVGQHWHPLPNDPENFYATYFFNMWRLENGKLMEHWDPDDLPNPLPEFLTKPLDQLTLSH